MTLSRRDFLQMGGIALGSSMVSARTWAVTQRTIPMRDVIVVLPGITGSVLRKGKQDVWAISSEGVLGALRSLGGSLKALELNDDPPDVDDLNDGVVASRVIPDLHLIPGLWKIDGYTKLIMRLQSTFDLRPSENFFEFPYDWRRDNRVAARKLARATHGWLNSWRERSGYSDARLILIAHSMGGLICRYFLEVMEGWKATRRLITFGTPYRGSMKALDFIVNGMVKSLGPVNILDLTSLLRSFTSIYQLLPTYPCIQNNDGQFLRVAEMPSIAHLDLSRVRKAALFHREIEQAVEVNLRNEKYVTSGYTTHPIVGVNQPTLQLAQYSAGGLAFSRTYQNTNLSGDGTVPQVSAVPIELSGYQREFFVSEIHGSIQNSDPVLVQLCGLLASNSIAWEKFRGSMLSMTLEMDDVYGINEPISVRARCEESAETLSATLYEVLGSKAIHHATMAREADGGFALPLPKLQEGAYRVSVAREGDSQSVSDVFVVAG